MTENQIVINEEDIIKYYKLLNHSKSTEILTSKLSEKIVRLYKTYRIPLLVNYNRRFTPEFITERKRIKSSKSADERRNIILSG